MLKTDEKNALSQLNLDTQQKDYRNIQNKPLARRMKEIKEGEELIEMCEILESYGNKRYGMEIEDKRMVYGEITHHLVPREDDPSVCLMHDWIYLLTA